MTEIQKITLADVFRSQGLDEQKIRDIMLLLYFKPQYVQQAFYYVANGYSYAFAASRLNVSKQQVSLYIRNNCDDINTYLRESENIVK